MTTFNIFNKARWLVTIILLITFAVSNVWGTSARISAYGSITSGRTYWMGASTGNPATDYYWQASGGIATSNSNLTGVAVTSASSGTVVKFTGSGTSWTIQFLNGNYLTIPSTDANGKYKSQTASATWTLSNASSLIKMTINSHVFQKNNSTTAFGSYKTSSNQKNIWLEPALKVKYVGNGNTSGTAPDSAFYLTSTTVTVASNTGSLAKTGYTFGGWNTRADGNGTNYTAGSGTFSITGDITLYAKWVSAGTSVTLSKAATTNGSFKLSSSCGGSELSPLSVTTTDAAQTVYVKATPASGYQVASVTSKLGSAAAETLTKSGDCYPVTYAKGASGTAVITVTFETASCSSYSFHDGTNGSSDWQINCFEYSGNADRQWIKNMTIRNKSHYYVGKQGNFYNDGLGNSNAKSYTNQMQYMQLALDRGHNSNNQLGSNYAGVKGTLLCYDNSNSDNLYVDFLPDGYYFILDAAGTPTALPMTCTNPDMTAANILNSNTVWETAIQTVTDVSKKYTVGIKADASIAGKAWQTTRYNTNENMTTLQKRNSSNGFTGTLAATDVTAGLRGKYRIWADNFSTTSGEKNWYAHFVPYYHVTYNGNGASGSVAASADVSCEASAAERTVKAAANGFTVPTGYTFGGWATSSARATAGTVDYAANADVILTSDIVLYAVWTPKEYSVTATLTNVTSSPAIPSTYTYTGSAASLSYTITPSSGYRLPTTITVTGTTYTWDSATGALVLTGTITSNVTITISAVQTHTVDWYVGGSAPANKIGDDGQTTAVDHGGKISDFPATTPDGSACDKTFVGWTNTSSYVHGTSPLFNDVAGSPTINADASFYAVFATESVATGYTYIGDDGMLEEDETYIFVSSKSTGSAYALKSSDLPNNNTSGVKGTAVSVTIATGIKVSTENSDLEFTCTTHTEDEMDVLQLGSSANTLRINGNGIGYGDSRAYYDNTGLYGWNNKGDTYYDVYYNSTSTKFEASSSASGRVYAYKKGGTTYTGHTLTCSDCGTSVTPTYTAAPAGGTVSVTKSAAAVASGSTVKTCTAVDLTVTITPAPHYTLTGFTATGLSTGTATISPAVGSTLPKTTETTFTVTFSSGATGTLNLTPTFTEDAHVAINWNVNGVNQSIAATEGLTWVYSGEDLTALPSNPSVPAGCSGTKVFAGWSAKSSGATEEDASYYDDLFTAVGDAPTGITSEKTFYAVFATSSANPLAGEVMWDEPFTGASGGDQPTVQTSGATVYNSTVLTYTCNTSYCKIYEETGAGGTSPEILVPKSSRSGSFAVSNIPTAGQTELILTYKTNQSGLSVTSGTSGVTIGDASVDGATCTRTITISQSPSATNNFALTFSMPTDANARLDDIHLVVPGSGTMTDYVTLCAPSYTITYNKNTEDAVTNLPSPTSVLQSTGSGTLSSTVPERATYTFSGWSETTSGAVAYAAGGSITGVTGDKTLYAVWTKTPVEELFLNYSELNKYVGDPAVTLEVTGVTPEGADATVTWSSNNSTVASVVAATGVVTFGTVGTATITATSTVTGTTTAYCYITVRNKPTASFTDLIHDGNGTDLSTYDMQNIAGTAIVFPTLDDYATPGDDCDSKHYIFVGWTTSDNNDDPEDHLVTSGELEDDQDKVFYAVWADGVEGVSYTKLTSNSFETGSTRYVIGVESGGDTYYLYDCASTDANNSWGYTTNAPGTNAPIQFSLSGTASALVVTSTEATARYLTPLTAKNFQMSATSKTVQLDADGTIHNTGDNSGWNLRGNTTDLRWYNGTTGTSAYFYKITAGAAVSYRTSCCTNNVPAPTVVATNTAYTVTLTWAAVDGATGYEVSWNGGAFTAATSPCVKSDLTASTDYTYKVRATYDPLVKCGALVASGSVTTDDVYTVTYSGGTGTGSCSPSGSVAPASYEAGATVTLAPTNSYSLTSNTFAAWVVKDADDNDVPVSNNQFTMPAKNVTVTATWTAVQDKYYDRMHDGTDGSHGGVQDGEGKYYLVREGCNYTVPTLTDDNDGDTDCHTTHYKLLGWIAQSHLKTDGSGEIKPGEESYIFQGGGTKSATGATYYAIWAIMTE